MGELTHGHSSGYLSAGVFAALIQQLVSGVSLREGIDQALLHLHSRQNHEEVSSVVHEAIRLANHSGDSFNTDDDWWEKYPGF